MTANLMQRAAGVLGGYMQTAAGRSVTYRRQQRVSSSIVGWVDTRTYKDYGENGIATALVMDDWTFTASELLVNGTQIEPQEGDVITETINDFENQYEVLPTEDGKCFEWLDSSGILLLVHTKRVERCPS